MYLDIGRPWGVRWAWKSSKDAYLNAEETQKKLAKGP